MFWEGSGRKENKGMKIKTGQQNSGPYYDENMVPASEMEEDDWY